MSTTALALPLYYLLFLGFLVAAFGLGWLLYFFPL